MVKYKHKRDLNSSTSLKAKGEIKLFNRIKEEAGIQCTTVDNVEKSITSISESVGKLADVINGNKEILVKINRNQSEIAMTLADIRDVMIDDHPEQHHSADHPDIPKLLSAMIETADMIEALYHFALQSQDDDLIEQSELMYKSMRKKYALAGLTKVAEEQTEIDAKLNTTIATDATAKEGIIAKTLISGYVYNGNIIRKSEVIIGSRKEVELIETDPNDPKLNTAPETDVKADEEPTRGPLTSASGYVYDVHSGNIIHKSEVITETRKEDK